MRLYYYYYYIITIVHLKMHSYIFNLHWKYKKIENILSLSLIIYLFTDEKALVSFVPLQYIALVTYLSGFFVLLF